MEIKKISGIVYLFNGNNCKGTYYVGKNKYFALGNIFSSEFDIFIKYPQLTLQECAKVI